MTTLGMGEKEMDEIADIITVVLKNAKPLVLTKGEHKGEESKNRATVSKEVKAEAKKRVEDLLGRFPLYGELDLDYLEKNFPYTKEK